MQDLREKLLKAGLVTSDQKDKAESAARSKGRTAGGKRRRKRPGEGSADSAETSPESQRRLALLSAVEKHRVRGDTRGDQEFDFELRSGSIGKMLVTREVAHGLTSGRFALIESGSDGRHVVVERAAVAKIKEVDAAAIRFYRDSSMPSA